MYILVFDLKQVPTVIINSCNSEICKTRLFGTQIFYFVCAGIEIWINYDLIWLLPNCADEKKVLNVSVNLLKSPYLQNNFICTTFFLEKHLTIVQGMSYSFSESVPHGVATKAIPNL